jgi:acetolactate synthase-1/2/3 large subunit
MKASAALIRILKSAGVRTIFALSGNQIMPLFDACLDENIRIVHVRHEAAALYMAEAHARITGGLGVAMVTAGAGLCNAIAPLFTASQSQTPVLLLSGDSEASLDNKGSFQEMDQVQITKAVTKYSQRLCKTSDLAEYTFAAIAAASTGMPGPAHLALAADVLTSDLDDMPLAEPQDPAITTEPASPSDRLAAMLAAAKRPLIIAGPSLGMPHYAATLRALEQRLQVPVVLMDSPRGLNDPRLGNFKSMARLADVIILVGKPVDFSLAYGAVGPFSAEAKWCAYIGDERILAQARGNLGDRLQEMADLSAAEAIAMLEQLAPASNVAANWHASLQDEIARRDIPAADHADDRQELNSFSFVSAVSDILASHQNIAAVSDGAEIGQWVQSMLTRHLVMINGVSGAIGGSLSYAMAIKLALPDRHVLAFMGDGTVGFHLAEFETAVREKLPVVVVIGNDLQWNAEVRIQERDFGPDRVFACGLSDARYDEVASAMGGHGEYVTSLAELAPAFERALASGRPACINVRIHGLAAPTFANE